MPSMRAARAKPENETEVDEGFAGAVSRYRNLAKGVNVYKGFVTHEKVAQALGHPHTPLSEVVGNLANS